MATDSPLSAQKLSANRKNAQRSTGPRTAAGKAASARNATTLGLFTKRDYVRSTERAEYRATHVAGQPLARGEDQCREQPERGEGQQGALEHRLEYGLNIGLRIGLRVGFRVGLTTVHEA